MNTICGEIIGNIRILVCKTPEGYNFFHVQADDENLLPVLDVIEDTLIKY